MQTFSTCCTKKELPSRMLEIVALQADVELQEVASRFYEQERKTRESAE
jgi:hypothetical protein